MGAGTVVVWTLALDKKGVVGMVFPYLGISCRAAIAALNFPPLVELTRISLLQWPAGSGHPWLCIYLLPSMNRLGKDVFFCSVSSLGFKDIHPLDYCGISNISFIFRVFTFTFRLRWIITVHLAETRIPWRHGPFPHSDFVASDSRVFIGLLSNHLL